MCQGVTACGVSAFGTSCRDTDGIQGHREQRARDRHGLSDDKKTGGDT